MALSTCGGASKPRFGRISRNDSQRERDDQRESISMQLAHKTNLIQERKGKI